MHLEASVNPEACSCLGLRPQARQHDAKLGYPAPDPYSARETFVTEITGTGSQAPSGMLIARDVAVPMPDGLVLRADVFRPDAEQTVPVTLTMGPYGKGLPYREAHFAPMWQWLISNHPEILDGSSG